MYTNWVFGTAKCALFIIGRAGASPPSRATGLNFLLYIYIYIYNISDAQCVHLPYRSKCFYALLF